MARPGGRARPTARPGAPRQAPGTDLAPVLAGWPCEWARPVLARPGPVIPSRHDQARPVLTRPGPSLPGPARPGPARPGPAQRRRAELEGCVGVGLMEWLEAATLCGLEAACRLRPGAADPATALCEGQQHGEGRGPLKSAGGGPLATVGRLDAGCCLRLGAAALRRPSLPLSLSLSLSPDRPAPRSRKRRGNHLLFPSIPSISLGGPGGPPLLERE